MLMRICVSAVSCGEASYERQCRTEKRRLRGEAAARTCLRLLCKEHFFSDILEHGVSSSLKAPHLDKLQFQELGHVGVAHDAKQRGDDIRAAVAGVKEALQPGRDSGGAGVRMLVSHNVHRAR